MMARLRRSAGFCCPETAKDLLSESQLMFQTLGKSDLVAEAQIEIAVCYWREGALDEARVMLREALASLADININSHVKAVGVLRSAIVEQSAKRFYEALQILYDATALFERVNNDVLKGKFHHELGTVLKDLGAAEQREDHLDRALIEFTAASFYFEQAGLSRYQACVENNLGFLFGTIGKFAEAHEHLDRAQALFTTLRDSVHLAQVEETRARVMLAEGHAARAESMAQAAVRTLEKGGEQSLLAEALTTHGIALARLHRQKQARESLERAVNLAEQSGDLDSAGQAALVIIEELSTYLSNEDLISIVARAEALLENSKDMTSVRRLIKGACKALYFIHGFPARPDWTVFSLKEVLHRYEAHFIEMALEDAGGVITQAAHLLGLPGHQNLLSIINRRHRSLRKARTQVATNEQSTVVKDKVSGGLEVKDSGKSRPIRILHVEDNQTVADAVRETLQLESWRVETCPDGAAALKKILSNDHYDLLLLDYDLPGVSGIELVRRARGAAHRQNTPIIVLSAALGEAEACEAGANEFLHKPEDIRKLVETITRLLSSAEDQET